MVGKAQKSRSNQPSTLLFVSKSIKFIKNTRNIPKDLIEGRTILTGMCGTIAIMKQGMKSFPLSLSNEIGCHCGINNLVFRVILSQTL